MNMELPLSTAPLTDRPRRVHYAFPSQVEAVHSPMAWTQLRNGLLSPTTSRR
jgi:hypothetical protein